MSSYDKLVKLACKPKAAPPKAKYLEPIVAATWSTEGAIHDVCKALAPRFREPNAIVVLKALIVLHYMIRNGSTDNILSYLGNSDVLRLRSVSDGNWEGYSAPQNLQNYAKYLQTRIRAYRDLKHDAIRVQSESNRDLRNQNSIEEDNNARGRRRGRGAGDAEKPMTSGHTRSKTIMGRRLKIMTVEKGLLRETKIVQQMINSLLECRFYLGDLEDELTIAALRMLVMDLLILFQAGNEGVINVLEHYFEMSHIDAQDALKLYRQFCTQTEGVVEFLGVAKKLQNLLNVPIPNLKHAPVSLVGALEEYLHDPNFEQNRIEYKANKEATPNEASTSSSQSATSPFQGKSKPEPMPLVEGPPAASASKPPSKQAMVDLLSAIEEEQSMDFNQANDPAGVVQQSATPNPFIQMGLATGQPFVTQSIQIQPTGFLIPQQTVFQPQLHSNPFGPSLQIPSTTGMLQPFAPNGGLPQLQPIGGDFLRPQATGANPFRQSMLVPQTTGAALFTPQAMSSQFQPGLFQPQPSSSGLPSTSSTTSTFSSISGTSSATSSVFTTSTLASPLSQPPLSAPVFSPPARPASTPLASYSTSSQQQPSSMSPPLAQPVKTHQTGSRNPFGPSVSELPPPVPKPPTLMELAMGIGTASSGGLATNVNGINNPPSQPTSAFSGLNDTSRILKPNGGLGGSDMGSIASTFAYGSKGVTAGSPVTGALNAQNTSTTVTGSQFSDSLVSSQISQFTGATTFSDVSSMPPVSLSPTLKPQTTGFGGLKPFKPTSSFGAALLDSLPPIPTASTGVAGGLSPPIGSLTSTSPLTNSTLNAQQTGFKASTLGVGLRPQMTGGGVANPFRASMAAQATTGPSTFTSATNKFVGSASPPAFMLGGMKGSTVSPTGAPNLGTGSFLTGTGTTFGTVPNFGTSANRSAPTPQQQSEMSLI